MNSKISKNIIGKASSHYVNLQSTKKKSLFKKATLVGFIFCKVEHKINWHFIQKIICFAAKNEVHILF